MKIKLVAQIFTAVSISSLLTMSTGMAAQTRWLNPFAFIGEPDVTVSHASSMMYPGSIMVDIVPEEAAEPPVVGEAEILKQFKLNEKHSLSGVIVCFRDFETTPQFAVQIYKKALPVLDVDTGMIAVGEDEPLLQNPQFAEPTQECTSIDLAEDILPEGDTLLLGIKFSVDTEPVAPVIISAVGLVQTPLYYQLAECDESVFNREVEPGVLLSDLVDTCAAEAKNHGKFVSCVNKIANTLKKSRIITGKEKGMITRCVANSNLP